jgi:hypothetical protein
MMSNANQVDWRDMFVGRDEDIAVLQAAWRKAKAGAPQVVSIVAESGLGKTRLVQEFFGWLSTTEDGVGGEGYWPDHLAREHNAERGREILSVNPEPSECVADGRKIPFLWWGVPLPNADKPNFVTTSLTQYQSRLQLHLLAYINAIKIAELKSKNLPTAGHAAFDLGVNVAGAIPQLAAAAILGGLTGGLAFAAIGALKGLGFSTKDYLDRRAEIKDLESLNLSPGHADISQREDIADIILSNLASVCSTPPEPLEKLPLVLVIDDAQWIRADLSLCKLLADLLAQAGKQHWPVMVIVTSWEAEWRAVQKIDWGSGERDTIQGIFTAPGVQLTEHLLEPASELSEVVMAAYPGLTADQITLVLQKADGNALCLYNVLMHLGKSELFFEGKSFSNALTANGVAKLAAISFEQIVRARLEGTPKYVQAALGLASLQGMQFSGQVVTSAAQRIAVENAERGLVEGENPHAFIRSQPSLQSEFRARYYQQAANENLDLIVGRDEAEKALRDALASLANPSAVEAAEYAVDATQQWQAQLSLFQSDDIDERTIAFEALYQLAIKANGDADFLAAQAYAKHWAEEWLLLKSGNSTVEQMFSLGDILRNLGNYELALAFDEITLSQARTNLTKARQEPGNQWIAFLTDSLARALERVGVSLFYLLRYPDALPYYQEAYDIRVKQFDAEPSDLRLRDLAVSSGQVASANEYHVGAKANLPLKKRALDLAEQYFERVSGDAAKPYLADALSRYGSALQAAEQVKAALPFLERAVAIRRELLGDGHDRAAMQNLSYALSALAGNQKVNQQHNSALANRSEQISWLHKLRDIWPTPQLSLELRHALLAGGNGAKAIGQLGIAASRFNEGFLLSKAVLEESETPENFYYFSLFDEAMYFLERPADPAAALPRLERVLQTKRAIVELRPDFTGYCDLATVLTSLAKAKSVLGQKDAAAALIDELPTAIKKLKGLITDGWQRANYFSRVFHLGDLRRLQGRIPEARVLFHETLEGSWRAANTLDTPDAHRAVSLILERLAMVAEAEGNLREAISYLLACMELKDQIVSRSDALEALTDQHIIASNLQRLYAAIGDTLRAANFSMKAIGFKKAERERAGMTEAPPSLKVKAQSKILRWMAGAEPDDNPIEQWIAPAHWLEPKPIEVSADTPRNAPCPCGSGERFKHCHGKL